MASKLELELVPLYTMLVIFNQIQLTASIAKEYLNGDMIYITCPNAMWCEINHTISSEVFVRC